MPPDRIDIVSKNNENDEENNENEDDEVSPDSNSQEIISEEPKLITDDGETESKQEDSTNDADLDLD